MIPSFHYLNDSINKVYTTKSNTKHLESTKNLRANQQGSGKIMFSCVSICRGRGQSRLTITHDAHDALNSSPSLSPCPDMRHQTPPPPPRPRPFPLPLDMGPRDPHVELLFPVLLAFIAKYGFVIRECVFLYKVLLEMSLNKIVLCKVYAKMIGQPK